MFTTVYIVACVLLALIVLIALTGNGDDPGWRVQ